VLLGRHTRPSEPCDVHPSSGRKKNVCENFRWDAPRHYDRRLSIRDALESQRLTNLVIGRTVTIEPISAYRFDRPRQLITFLIEILTPQGHVPKAVLGKDLIVF
jgi:hypothetical protein